MLSSWPSHLGKIPRARKSGTSCATPIAAGVAAVVLEIAGLYLSRQDEIPLEDKASWQDLRSKGGMCLAFQKMARSRDGYDYVRPWRFMGRPSGFKLDTAMAILQGELKAKL